MLQIPCEHFHNRFSPALFLLLTIDLATDRPVKRNGFCVQHLQRAILLVVDQLLDIPRKIVVPNEFYHRLASPLSHQRREICIAPL